MPTKDLWERPMIVTMTVEDQVLTFQMVPVVKDFVYVFPDDLPGLPPNR